MRRAKRFRGGALSAGAVVLGLLAASCSMGPKAARPTALRAGGRIPVVSQGKGLARLVLPADAPAAVKDGANLLAQYIAKSTGTRLEITGEPGPEDGAVAIHIGATSYVKGLKLDLAGVDQDGFVIAFPDARHVVLLGAGDAGQEYAAYEFLERYVGVRWLFPGSLGEHVPLRQDLAIPNEPVRSEPRFRHRVFSGLGVDEKPAQAGEQSLWAKRNRMRERIKFHHNLWRLFPPEQFGQTHPEFFPVLRGQRFVPQPAPGKTREQDVSAQIGWQPCFTAPESAAEAVKAICGSFGKNPQTASYSFGVNDSGGHCECPTCMALDGGRKNALGIRDASTSYYTWCNEVARGVNAKYPDACFGLLAYSEVYSPAPGLRLNEHIVPFITYDRMKWADRAVERKGHAANGEWAKAAPVLGWYDYIYGGHFYVAPRVYFRTMAEYLRYGYRHNVRHYYAEAYPSADWHEGPKLYVALKLLWDPGQDVDKLLRDWYTCAVGPAAAPFLAQYFEHWERFWTRRAPACSWFRNNGYAQYLNFSDTGYMEALTPEDLRRCEALLRQALAAATTAEEQSRARFFLDGFLARKPELEDGIPPAVSGNESVLAAVVASAFDKDMNGWGTWQRDYSKAKFAFDAAAGCAAPGSLKAEMSGSQASPVCFTRQIPVAPGKTYRAAVSVRAENLAADAGVNLTVKWKGAKGQWLQFGERSAFSERTGPGEWRRLNVCVRVGTGGRWAPVSHALILLTAQQTDQGTVWFDDFSFEEIGAPTPPLTERPRKE